MGEFDERTELHHNEVVDAESKKPLVIFKTDIDRYGRNITAMSDFFDDYVQQMALVLREPSVLETAIELPITALGIINDVIHQADIIIKGNITLLPDFDNLHADIKTKLKRGIYCNNCQTSSQDNPRR